ncbi:MAG: transporter substrate-binding domain-containing protein, partial [Spirochaetota bacterium]
MLRGMIIDFWNLWSVKTGIPVKIIHAPWKESINMIKEKKADIHSGLFITEDRSRFMDFSKKFFTIKTSLFMRSNIDNPLNVILHDSSLKIGAQYDTGAYLFLKQKFPWIHIKVYEDTASLIAAAANGEIDAFSEDEPSARYYLSNYHILGEFKIISILSEEGIHAGITKNNVKLLNVINEGISLITEDDLLEMKRKWLIEESYNILKDWRFYTAIVTLIIIAAIIILVISFINRSLKHTIMIKKQELEKELLARRKAEQLLAQAQRAEVLGILSRGMLHDFNNILMGVTGSVSLLHKELINLDPDKASQLEKYFVLIKNSFDKAVEILNRLRALNKKKNDSFAQIDLNATVDEVVQLCKTAYGKKITININANNMQRFIFGDATSIMQILLNVCINAIHAMTIMRDKEKNPNDNILTIDIVEKYHENKGRMFGVIITDTGVGMDEETIKNLGKPFFTTKDPNTGTGLGLAMVFHLIEKMNGYIDIESTP